MAQTIDFVRDRKALAGRTLLLDTNVLLDFFDVDAYSALVSKGYLSRMKVEPRLGPVKAHFKGRLYTTWANALECVRAGSPTEAAGRAITSLIASTVTIEERAPAEVNRRMRDLWLSNAPKFVEDKLWGAFDVFTASVAIQFRHVVLTRDLADFDKLPGVEYLVGW